MIFYQPLSRSKYFGKILAATGILICFWLSTTAWAQAASDDRYAPVYPPSAPAPSAFKKVMTNLLVYPFELFKWPTDKTMLYVEKHHIDKKVKWIYDQLADYGITPYFNVVNISSMSIGTDLDIIRAIRQRQRFPDAKANAWIKYANHKDFDVGTEVGLERIRGTGFSLLGYFDYDNKSSEHFYGIGPHSSLGDSSVYRRETTTLESTLKYAWQHQLETALKFGYTDVNISDGRDGGSAQFNQYWNFRDGVVPGLHGNELLNMGTEISHDTRNKKRNSTQGGYQKFAFSYHEGVGGSKAEFFKYKAELAQYQRLWSERRVLAVHFYGEYNSELNHRYVPFHQMPMLGGYGAEPELSHPMRAYINNRYTDKAAALFNVEYRYTIWEYRDFDMTSVAFLDEGQVFSELSRFKFEDFRSSYGLGLRVGVAAIPILSLEVAHGDEGTKFYVKTRAPF